MIVSRKKWMVALATFLMAGPLVVAADIAQRGAPATNANSIEIRGKLVRGKDQAVAVKTDSGTVHDLLFTRMSAALFTDTNYQSKTLVLKGRLLPESSIFEVTGNLRSLRDGALHELFYYCDICAIEGIEPGECMCCREPVRLIEEPVNDAGKGKNRITSKELQRK